MKKEKCSRCGYEYEANNIYMRCPRCHKILIKKCSECKKCDLLSNCAQGKT